MTGQQANLQRQASRRTGGALRDAVTMALYLAIVLYAALVALPDQDRLEPLPTTGLVWGTAIGLTLAHQFAFSLSALMVVGQWPDADERQRLGAQGLAAFVVAALVTLPVVFLDTESGYEAAETILAAIIGVAAYASARRSGAAPARALLLTGILIVIAGGIIVFKAAVGH